MCLIFIGTWGNGCVVMAVVDTWLWFDFKILCTMFDLCSFVDFQLDFIERHWTFIERRWTFIERRSYIALLYMTSQSALHLHVYMYYVYFTYNTQYFN